MRFADIRVKVLKPHTAACAKKLALQEGWITAWWLTGEHEWRSGTGRKGVRYNKTLWSVAACNLRCGAKALIHDMDVVDMLALSGKLPK